MDKQILDYTTNGTGKLIPARCSVNILEKHGYLNYLKTRYSDNTSDKLWLRETLYRLLNNIETPPVCKTCGNPVTFTNNSYPAFCCPKCRNNDPEVLAKNKEGVSKALKQKYKESGDEIKEKRKNTLSERYGETTSCSPFAVKEIQEKVKSTIQERYGVENVLQLKKYHEKSIDTLRQKSVELWKSRGLDIEYTDHCSIIIHNGCSVHGDIELDINTFNNRTKEERIHISEVCPICNPLNYFSGKEVIIKKLLDELGVNYVTNDRKIIKPLELDFYLLDYKLAIEFNGIFFHRDDSGKPKDYHKNKSELCEQQGIKLIHIWENDWINNKDLIISMLKNKLGKSEHIIYGRQCKVYKITSKESSAFLKENHLQGNVNAKYRYGLFYNDELVSVMTFGNVRKALGANKNDNCCELYRYCTKQNYRVIGGAGKLFNFAIDELKNEGFTHIISYAKRDWSNGELYKKLGFSFEGYTVPGYFWANKFGLTYNRFKFRKSEIAKTEEEKKMTEVQIMKSRGYYRCYDSGNLKFRYTI